MTLRILRRRYGHNALSPRTPSMRSLATMTPRIDQSLLNTPLSERRVLAFLMYLYQSERRRQLSSLPCAVVKAKQTVGRRKKMQSSYVTVKPTHTNPRSSNCLLSKSTSISKTTEKAMNGLKKACARYHLLKCAAFAERVRQRRFSR
jgi:hypothetical protein